MHVTIHRRAFHVKQLYDNVAERTDYDDQNRVIRRWNGFPVGEQPGNEDSLRLRYDGNGAITTTITNTLGHVSQDRYNAYGVLVSQTNAQSTSSRTYDTDFNWRTTTDGNGNWTFYDFNSMGQPELVVDPLGNYTRMAYDDLNHLTTITDALDHTTHYTYKGNLLTVVTDTLTGTVSNSYDDGLLVQMVDHGVTTTYGYDEFRQRIAITDALDHVTTYGYDAVGRLVTTTQYANTPHKSRITVNRYDDGDNLIRVTQNYTITGGQNYVSSSGDTYNLATRYHYDAVGNRTRVTDTLDHVTLYEYDAANRLIATTVNYTTTYPGHGPGYQWNVTTTYGYDALGNQTHVTDTLGHVTLTEYDPLNRPLTVTANVSTVQRADTNITSTYGYDAAGRTITTTDTAGRVTRTWYDLLGRPLTVTTNYTDGIYNPAHPDRDLSTLTVYDVVGQVTARVQL